MAEIKTYDVIKNYAEDGKAALASQIWDEGQQKFQSQINQETANDGLVSSKEAQSFTTAEKAQARANIDALGCITQQEFNAIFND